MMKSSEPAKVPIGLPIVTMLAVDIVKGDYSGSPVLRFWSFGCTFMMLNLRYRIRHNETVNTH
jgi:hypothetical protein